MPFLWKKLYVVVIADRYSASVTIKIWSFTSLFFICKNERRKKNFNFLSLSRSYIQTFVYSPVFFLCVYVIQIDKCWVGLILHETNTYSYIKWKSSEDRQTISINGYNRKFIIVTQSWYSNGFFWLCKKNISWLLFEYKSIYFTYFMIIQFRGKWSMILKQWRWWWWYHAIEWCTDNKWGFNLKKKSS